MFASVWERDLQAFLDEAKAPTLVSSSFPFPSPLDWRDKWIYFIMLDRFNNPALAQPRHLPFDDPTFVGYQGGSYSGVRDKLPYLKQLGVGTIWLSPVLKNCPFSQSYHGYGIHDFLSSEPRFADDPQDADQELRDLVDAAHALGIYVIFDIVLNHTGNVFAYRCQPGDHQCSQTNGSEAWHKDSPQQVLWRDPSGAPRPEWPIVENIDNPPLDATVWPQELRRNEYFRRQGLPGANEVVGDFSSLKQMLTVDSSVRNALIRIYQYVIARYDCDGFRIDTLKFVNRDFALTFGNAIREYALSIGKKNFFTFGEVWGDEKQIARFIGRNAGDPHGLVGVDAALDFPLAASLPKTIKGFAAPSHVVQMYQERKTVQESVVSSHGEASRFFVTFLDNHDFKARFSFIDPNDPHRFDDQLTMGLACLFSLQGIPCLYYGTEQGLHGAGSDEAVREALWGKPNAFDSNSHLYQMMQLIAGVRSSQPALRYGRQYFRPISGDGYSFAVSNFNPGVLAFSRILNDTEVVVVANADQRQEGVEVEVIVDMSLNPVGSSNNVLFSNKPTPSDPTPVMERAANTVVIREVDGVQTSGPVHTVRVNLQPLEVQILGKH